jgi:hypothetical protein
VSRIQGNAAVLLRNLSLNSGNDISPGEGFAVSEFATGTFAKAVVDDLSAVSRIKARFYWDGKVWLELRAN